MKSNELRIGNLVDKEFPGYHYPQDAEWGEHIIKGEDIEEANLTWFRPIPLTEEWLLKFGWAKEGKISLYEKDNSRFQIWVRPDNKVYFLLGGTNNSVELKHVHSLQNLVFALTGEELICK